MSTLEEAINQAICNNDIEKVYECVHDGVDLSIQWKNKLPLGLACQLNCLEIVIYLLSKNVDVDQRDFFDQTALHLAVRSGNIPIVRIILKAGANVNKADSERIRPIHVAACLGNCEMFDLLISYGAYINAKDRNRNTPLHCALLNENIQLIDMILEAGADVNSQDSNGDTPLMIAAIKGYNVSVMKTLIQAGANPNISNKKGRTPLFATVYHNYYTDVAMYLLESGASPFVIDRYNDCYTLLHYACIHGNIKIAKKLISLGCDVDARSTHDETPVYLTVKRAFTELVQLLVKRGCNVNVLTKNAFDHAAPIHAAIGFYQDYANFAVVVDCLIDAGAYLEDFSSGNDNGVEFKPLVFQALISKKYDFASYLIALGAPIRSKYSSLGSVLHKAFCLRRIDIMELCINVGANLNDEAWVHGYRRNHLLYEGFGSPALLEWTYAKLTNVRCLTDMCRILIRSKILKCTWKLKQAIKTLNISFGHANFLLFGILTSNDHN